MRYIIYLIIAFVFTSCISKKEDMTPHDLESLIAIYANGVKYKPDDVFYLDIENEQDDIITLSLMNTNKNANFFNYSESYYVSKYQDINLVISVSDIEKIKEFIPNQLNFTKVKNLSFNPDYEGSIVDYTELFFVYDVNKKSIIDIEYDGLDYKVNKIKIFPFFKIERDTLF